MSRNERRIRKHAESLGLTVKSVQWTPIGRNFEMCGPEGGWHVEYPEDDDHIGVYDTFGYNVDELLENMKVTASLKKMDDADANR